MDITVITNQIPVLMVLIGALVVLTNIIVEVLKNFTWEKIPTNVLAVLVALVLTIATVAAWAAYNAITLLWFHWAAAVVAGFMVAYAAMFGFDKLKEALGKVQELKN